VAGTTWRLPVTPALTEDAVHLWQFSLDPASWPLALLHSYLAPDEVMRAERFVFRPDRERYTAARGYLRLILAHYAQCSPRQIRFGYGPHGKPYLNRPLSARDLTFNLSHTRGRALCAVARWREIGVDIEQIRPGVDIDGIALTTFSPNERSQLAALPIGTRLEAFFACWTRKEAYIKARGEGLGYPLHSFDVNLGRGEPPALLRSREGADELRRWELRAIDAGEGYAATLVVARPATFVHQVVIP
jgi:4'-phosphopantetheinyl transferase